MGKENLPTLFPGKIGRKVQGGNVVISNIERSGVSYLSEDDKLKEP